MDAQGKGVALRVLVQLEDLLPGIHGDLVILIGGLAGLNLGNKFSAIRAVLALDIALELSSMGIRVDEDSLRRQLAEAGCEERAELAFQKALLNGELPYTIGGGIGQSRICMFFLRKAHIGEIQASIWPADVMEAAGKAGIPLL